MRLRHALVASLLFLPAAACGSSDEPDRASTAGTQPTETNVWGTAADGTVATTDPGSNPSTDPAAPGDDVVTGGPTTAPSEAGDDVYAHTGAGMFSPTVADHLPRVYVPNEVSGTVTVIDPATFEVIDSYPTGFIPQHVVPSYDLDTLYVLNNSGNTITPIDPTTAKPGTSIPVHDPYNLYFLPDGSEAIIVAEAEQRLDFADPETFAVHSSIQTDCAGINHLDFAPDGSYLIASCEFDGRVIKVDLVNRQVAASFLIDMGLSGKTDVIQSHAQPQDVRLSPDGTTFYVADLISDGVYTIDGASFTLTGFIPTGVAAHGLYPSRDGTKLYVINRGTNAIPAPGSFKGQAQGSVTVIDFATDQVVDQWPIPDGGSPDMGNVTADGTQLWVAGRYDAEVYVFDTASGELLARIPVGENPHGLTVWPQPGRYSLGHTGNMR